MYGQIRFKQTEIGKIPEDWEVEELKNVLEEKGYVRGPFGSALRRNELKTEGIPVYEQEHAIYNSRKFRYHIDENKFRELSRFLVKEDDLIISCSGTLGKVSMISKTDPKGIISQALLLLRPNINKILPRYLKYFFYSPKGFDALVSRSSGSVQVNLAKREVIETIKLALPAITEQSHIVKILSDLDSKIALNHQTNRTLEAIGQALFKRWFIDFEFPNEEGKPYKSSGGEMVYSQELEKEIPKGWSVRKLGDYIQFMKGRKPKAVSDKWFEGYLQQILIDTFNGGKPNYANPEKMVIVETTEPIMVMDGASSGRIEIGYCGIVGSTLSKVVVNSTSLTNSFLFHFLKTKESDINLNPTGTSIPHTDKGRINDYSFALPNKDLLLKFDIIANQILHKIMHNKKEIITLSRIRDTLLPKLVSGEIRVKGGENA